MIGIRIVKPEVEFITPKYMPTEWKNQLLLIEECGRVSHRSEGRMKEGTCEPFIKKIAMKYGHESIIEHGVFTVCFVCDRSCSHQIVRHRIAAYCVTGDTELVGFSVPGRSPKRWTIEQLYNWQDDPKRKGRVGLIALRSVNRDGIIIPGKIKKIVDTGLQHTFQVKTRCGKQLRCTDNEWFVTKDGWKQLHELSVGDRIKVNGDLAYRDEEWLRRHYLDLNMERTEVAALAGVSDACIGKWVQKHGLQKPRTQYPNRQGGGGVTGMHGEEGRAAISERMSGERNPQWKGDEASDQAGRVRAQRKYASLGTCDCCDNPATHRHHIDEDTLNNNESNVIPLCDACHASHHTGQAVVVVHYTPITSILACGIERTFDVEMDTQDPELRNYIANGFLVHNTQESQRYCDYSDTSRWEALGLELVDQDDAHVVLEDHGRPEKGHSILNVIMPHSIAGREVAEMLHGKTIFRTEGMDWDTLVTTRQSGQMTLRQLLLELASTKSFDPAKLSNVYKWVTGQVIAYSYYLGAREDGVPSEDARSHLTNACRTLVYTTYNFREWRHFFKMRSDRHAQWQIRILATNVLKYFKEEVPVITTGYEVNPEWL